MAGSTVEYDCTKSLYTALPLNCAKTSTPLGGHATIPESVPLAAMEFGPSTAAPERNGGPFGGVGTRFVTWCSCKVETCCHHSQSAMFPRRSRQGYWPTDDLRSRPGRCRHSEQGRLETCTQPPSPPDLHHATLCHTYSTENRIRKDQCHSERWLYSTASADQRVRRPGSSQARCHSGCRQELTHDRARK